MQTIYSMFCKCNDIYVWIFKSMMQKHKMNGFSLRIFRSMRFLGNAIFEFHKAFIYIRINFWYFHFVLSTFFSRFEHKMEQKKNNKAAYWDPIVNAKIWSMFVFSMWWYYSDGLTRKQIFLLWNRIENKKRL